MATSYNKKKERKNYTVNKGTYMSVYGQTY